MTFQTEAILLHRTPMREVDEILTFFTQKCGKIKCFSYGTKSPLSQRAKALVSHAWTLLDLQRKQDKYRLINAQKKRASSPAYKATHLFLMEKILKVILQKMPYHLPEKDIYQLLKNITHKQNLHKPVVFQEMMFYYGFLQLMGQFPSCENNFYPFDMQVPPHAYCLSQRKYLPWHPKTNMPALSPISLCFLKYFEIHFSLHLSFYENTYLQVNTWKQQHSDFDIRPLCAMGEQLVQMVE